MAAWDMSCPFCEALPKDWQDLAEHLAFHHGDARVRGRRLVRNAKGNVGCWCRVWFPLGQRGFPSLGMEVELGGFARHLKRQGGAAAHVLSLTLGVRP